MTTDNTSTTPDRMDLTAERQPVHPILMLFSVACFVGAFITDIVYWQTVAVTWETFSIWLITVGLVLAGFAVIALVVDFVGGKRSRTVAMPYAVGYALAVLVSLINAFVHSRDGYTAVVPTGLTLSALAIIILLIGAWVGSLYRHRIGASI